MVRESEERWKGDARISNAGRGTSVTSAAGSAI